MALPRIRKTGRNELTYLDERRRHLVRGREVRPLHHRLQHLHDTGDSDDDTQTPNSRDTDEPESRPSSRMSFRSGVSDSEDDYGVYTIRTPSAEDDTTEYGITDSVEFGKSEEDLALRKLGQDSVQSKKRKRHSKDLDVLDARKRPKDDSKVFDVHDDVLNDVHIVDDATRSLVSPHSFDSDVFADDKSALYPRGFTPG